MLRAQNVLVLLTALAILLMGYFFISTKSEQIEFNVKEVYGTEYLRPLHKLLPQVSRHENLSLSGASGAAEQQALVQLRTDIDAQFDAVAEVDKRLAPVLNSTNGLTALRSSWDSLKSQSATMARQALAEKHQKLIQDILGHIQEIGDRSNLILDPDLDSYYLMDGVVVSLPSLIAKLDTLRSSSAALAGGEGIPADVRVRLAELLGVARFNLDAIRRNFEVSFRESTNFSRADLRGRLRPSLDTAVNATEAVLGRLSQELVSARMVDRLPETAQPAVDGAASPVSAPARANVDLSPEILQALDPLTRLYSIANDTLADLAQRRVNAYTRQRQLSIPILGGSLILAVVLAFVVNRRLGKQVNQITDVFEQVKAGNLQARAKVVTRDAVGSVATSLNEMLDDVAQLIQSREERDQIQRSIAKLLDEVSGVATGDLTREAEVTADITGAIADSFNMMMEELRTIIGRVQDTTKRVGVSASEIQKTAQHLAKGSEAQSEQIVSTSAAIDEMAASIQHVSDNAARSASVAKESLSNASRGADMVRRNIEGMNTIRDHVRETAKRIKRLGESSQEIGEIVQLIGDIAERTSILALNASIQAAMAGEAGRGFAVVAEEVERLAVRSTDATKRISTLIKTIQTETSEAVTAMEDTTKEVVQGSKLANDAGSALEQIESVSKHLADLIQMISLASSQQARGSEALAQSMSDIAEITQQSAAGTKQATSSMSELAGLADELRASVSRFQLPGSRN